VYDMYAYDESGVPDTGATGRSAQKDFDFTKALQFALDRRDNGGDALRRPQ
jgi:hypothetical protein